MEKLSDCTHPTGFTLVVEYGHEWFGPGSLQYPTHTKVVRVACPHCLLMRDVPGPTWTVSTEQAEHAGNLREQRRREEAQREAMRYPPAR